MVAAGIVTFSDTSPTTVAGVVSDGSGYVMVKADITLIACNDEGEAARLTTRADESGHYNFSAVPTEGIRGIVLEVTKDGKKPSSQKFTLKPHRDGVLVIDITVGVNPDNSSLKLCGGL